MSAAPRPLLHIFRDLMGHYSFLMGWMERVVQSEKKKSGREGSG